MALAFKKRRGNVCSRIEVRDEQRLAGRPCSQGKEKIMENPNRFSGNITIMLAAVLLACLIGYLALAKSENGRVSSAVSAAGRQDLSSVPRDPQTPPASAKSMPGEKDLIGKDLAGWNVTRGTWDIDAEGTLANIPVEGEYGRIETAENYHNFILTCKILINKVRYGEVQFRGLTFGLEYPDMNTWSDLEVVAKDRDTKVKLNGKPVKAEAATPGDASPIAFYVMKNGVMKLKNLRIKIAQEK